ncbi:MAG: hypothetical protein GX027_02235 [Clostridiaceae bacterium]|jgi:hypothetical protein|nr:hypothetical protein [Clostridiaceae bacterium]
MSNTAVEYDIADLVNLRYRSEGYEIFRVRAAVSSIGCEKAEDRSFLVFGEYIFFLILRSMDKRRDYSIKAIRCPFIKNVPISGKLSVFINSARLQVSLAGPPDCSIEDMDVQPANKTAFCHIEVSFRVEFRESGEEPNDAVLTGSEARETTGQDSSGSSPVRVWRVDSSKNHTIEQLLGMDRKALAQLGEHNNQEQD